MRKVLLKSVLLVLTISCICVALTIHSSYAAGSSITVSPTSVGDKTMLDVSNNPSSTSDVASFNIEIKNGNFKSFSLQNGWVGKKTSSTAITFIGDDQIKPGDSTTFEIRTSQSQPYITWKAFDKNNNELGSGEVNAPVSKPSESNTQTGKTSTQTQSSQNQPDQPPPKPKVYPGILDQSSFRIIPSTPAPGFDVRVVGQSFSSSAKLDLYLGGQKIDSFSSNTDGNFVATTTVPTSQSAGNVNFVLKDQLGNQRTFTTIIKQPPPPHTVQQAVTLTANIPSILHRGEARVINGTATPGSTITFSILDTGGKSITTFTATSDKDGHFSVSQVIPIDRPFGKYTAVISDGKTQVSKDYTVVSTHQISITTPQPKYEAGQTVVINGTAISDQRVSVIITDPTGNEVYAKDLNVTSDGKISLSYPLSQSALKGTYVVEASQGSDQVPLYFGVGVDPVSYLTASLDKLNYAVTDKPVINVSGPPSSTLNLVIVDPSDKEKFSDTIAIGPDGLATYSFNLTSYTPGIYSAVITRGNDKVVKEFAVGLTTGSGTIKIKTVKDKYLPGDNIILLGNANPNTILLITLRDPNGSLVKSEQTFSDKNGIFSAFDFRIPGDAKPGEWKIDATSGLNHISVPLEVKSGLAMTIEVDKNPPTYNRGDIVTISGTGAGNSVGVTINIIGPANNVLNTLQIMSTNRGDYSTEWFIPKTFNPGTITIQAVASGGTTSTNVTVQ